MKHILLLSAFLFFVFSSSAFAEGSKIGVVNVGLLLEKAPQAVDASNDLEKQFAPQQQELKLMAVDLDKKQKDFQKNQLIMTETQKQASQREINMMARDIQRKRNDIQELVNIKRNEALAIIQQEVNEAIKQIGKQQNFDLILYEGIAYTNSKYDVTDSVLSYLKERHDTKRASFNK